MYREDYLLAKVGVDVGVTHWFGLQLSPMPQPPGEPENRGWFKRRREQKRQQAEYQRQQEKRQKEQDAVAQSISMMRQDILTAVEEAGAMGELHCVYMEDLWFLKEEGKGLFGLWKEQWNISEFRDYKKFCWIKPLLKTTGGTNFVLLGTALCVPRILEYYARRMKSLCWYLREEDFTEEVQEFAEEFYMEYGLAITVSLLSGKDKHCPNAINANHPICVLDFTEEEKIFPAGLNGTDVWIDFCSVEEKRKRIQRLASGVQYESLVSYWRRCEKNRARKPEELRNIRQNSRFS